MSKKLNLDEIVGSPSLKQEAPEEIPVVEEAKGPAFPYKAYSIIHIGNDYKLMEIGFNLETGDTSAPVQLENCGSREEARERFKIAVVKGQAF